MSKTAYLFPGQGAQKPGMAKDIYEVFPKVREMFENANEILGFRITDIMFGEDEEALKQTKVTQPAIFLHSVGLASVVRDFHPDMAAGHSLGEFSALVACGAMSFEDGLKLVAARAAAMQKACEATPSTMAAVVGMGDAEAESVCSGLEGVVPANYNCPGQIVVSGTMEGIEKAAEALKAAGARRVLPLKVGGAFHSPLMEPARLELAEAIGSTPIKEPVCPVYQNVDARPHIAPQEIKKNLLMQLTATVRWTQTVLKMKEDGASMFVELGPGDALRGLVKRCIDDYTFPILKMTDEGVMIVPE